MPRVNRAEICAADEVQVFHLVNRCVRRTHLCGVDRRSRKDYSHRKQWIRDRLEVLAGIFGIDVLGFSVMSNHLHVVVRTRPDIVREWSDAEVAQRWWRLFPQRREADGRPSEPTEFELNAIRNDVQKLKTVRQRLSDISWLMRCVAEPIARRANREDEVTGRFWEGRFKAQPLLDETALAACMAYVDLNPIRAKLATTPETSEFTSVQERIADRTAAEEINSKDAHDARVEHGKRAGWMSPVALEPPRKRVREKPTPRRASNRGCLPMTLEEYLQLVDWTGRQLRRDKPGRIPPSSTPVLERLELSSQTWLDLVKQFRRRFRFEAGRASSREAFRQQRKQRAVSQITG